MFTVKVLTVAVMTVVTFCCVTSFVAAQQATDSAVTVTTTDGSIFRDDATSTYIPPDETTTSYVPTANYPAVIASSTVNQRVNGGAEGIQQPNLNPAHPQGNCCIDYRCADGRFLMSPRGMAVSKTKYLSSSETIRVNAGIREWKLRLSELTLCQESVGGICFTNK
jgi:hypothetical protein